MSALSTGHGETRKAGVRRPPSRILARLGVRWHRARRRTTWRDVAVLAAVLAGLGVSAVLWHHSGLMFNHTASMPVGLYRVQRVRPTPNGHAVVPARGVTVVWCLPERLAATARRRGYLVRGRCPGGVEPILKTVAAVSGDSVAVDSIGMTVNGLRLPNSRPLAFDSRGRPLARVPRGTYVVPPGHAWLWSPHAARSFDSRYYGAVPVSGLVGLAQPVWLKRPPLPDN